MNVYWSVVVGVMMLLGLAGCRTVPPTCDQAVRGLASPRRAHWSAERLCEMIDIVVAGKDMRARPYLAAALFDRSLDSNVQMKAAWALGTLRDEDAFRSLVRAVDERSTEPNVREAAGKALSRYQDDRVLPVLLRAIALRAPGSSGFYDLFAGRSDKARAVPLLIELLESEATFDIRTQDIGETTARALGEIRDTRATEPLMKAVEGSNWYTRVAAIQALGKIGDKRCVPLLLRLAEANEGPFGHEAMDALGEIGDASAVPCLCNIVNNKQGSWAYAARALGRIGDKRAEPCLLKRLSDKGNPDSYVAWVLSAVGRTCSQDTDISLIRSYCTSSNNYLRQIAATALGNIGNADAAKDVVPLLDDKGYRVCEAAAKAIGSLPSPLAVQGLVDSLIRNAQPGLARLKFDSLVKLCGDDPEPIVSLLERTDYEQGLAGCALVVFVKRQDPKYIVPVLRCFQRVWVNCCACREFVFDHSEAGRFILKVAKDNPGALDNVKDKTLRDLWAQILSRDAKGNGDAPTTGHAGQGGQHSGSVPAPTR